MKKMFFLLLAVSLFSLGSLAQEIDKSDRTNNFYDNEELHPLKTGILEIAGEITNPGIIDLSSLPVRSLIVKEALPTAEGNSFVGAYRYDGYSLFDIINLHTPDKKNQEAFPPIIDLYAEIENEQGEKVIFSWGEIYYPNHLHEIIIATQVMRIVPSKTKELWPLPTNAKIVAGHDLLTSRNISNPTKITIKSASRKFVIEKGMNPMHAPAMDIFVNESKTLTLTKPAKKIDDAHYEAIFYGRGRGIHSTTPFEGQMLKEVLAEQIPFTAQNIKEAYLIVAAKDGYRGVFSYSEIFNRNDQSELLLIYDPKAETGGTFRLFPAGDFFSDRAIKSTDRIYFEQLD